MECISHEDLLHIRFLQVLPFCVCVSVCVCVCVHPHLQILSLVGDIPKDFRVGLYRGERVGATLTTIHSSKGVGEPPFFLGASVFFAAKDAM